MNAEAVRENLNCMFMQIQRQTIPLSLPHQGKSYCVWILFVKTANVDLQTYDSDTEIL